jgi:hypothetical protein
MTPPALLEALGPFDLDPCSPVNRPWDTAATHYTVEDDGLTQPWEGRVWLNPPYGRDIGAWLRKLAEHGTGTALIFARTETKWFHENVWPYARALFFFDRRLHFYRPDGTQAKGNAGAPSVLVAYGDKDALKLATAPLSGTFVDLGDHS